MGYLSGVTALIGSGSTSTSSPWWVGDFRLLTISFASSGSLGPSRFTIQGSNDNGFQAALAGSTSNTGWSLVSGVNMIGVTPGVVTLDPPGFRWMRITVAPANHSAASAVTITVAGTSF
jgi:hypothetical protein